MLQFCMTTCQSIRHFLHLLVTAVAITFFASPSRNFKRKRGNAGRVAKCQNKVSSNFSVLYLCKIRLPCRALRRLIKCDISYQKLNSHLQRPCIPEMIFCGGHRGRHQHNRGTRKTEGKVASVNFSSKSSPFCIQTVSLGQIQICRKIRGIGCVTRALARARFTQHSPHIFLYFCIHGEKKKVCKYC